MTTRMAMAKMWASTGRERASTGRERASTGRPYGDRHAASLGAFINGYKASVTRGVMALPIISGASVWQRNYYEHIIRDEADLERIRQYIRLNPARWADDDSHTRP